MANIDVLQKLGCVVTLKCDNQQDEYSVCGVLVDLQYGIILSHGSLISDLCLKNRSLYSKVKNGDSLQEIDLKGSKFETMISSKLLLPNSAANTSPVARKSNYSPKVFKQNDSVTFSYTSKKCRLLYAFRNEDFFQAIARIMPNSNWTFTAEPTENSPTNSTSNHSEQDEQTKKDEDMCFELLSYILLFKTDSVNTISQKDNLMSSLIRPSLRKHRSCIGDIAEIVSTPFGSLNPVVFFNTYSRGVVCNVSGPHDCWILTDARCIPGSEGGPLFTGKENQRRYLTGIVAASLCWKHKEWVGFSLVCSLNSIFSSLDYHLKMEQPKMKFDLKEWIQESLSEDLALDLIESATDHCSLMLYSTVMVKVGSTWGSGVIINKKQGVILTCSHVVKDSDTLAIMIKPHKSSAFYRATLIYRNAGSLQRPYDLAILKCPEATSSFQSNEVPSMCIPNVGEKVFVVGHALFNSDNDLHPSLCAGVVSKILTVQSQTVMIQTTCAVHPGASGGPLLNSSGELVGIVVCNTIDKGSNSSYPHVNMSIPAVSIWPAVYNYIKTGDVHGFSKFEISDLKVKRLWTLDNCVLDGDDHFARSKL